MKTFLILLLAFCGICAARPTVEYVGLEKFPASERSRFRIRTEVGTDTDIAREIAAGTETETTIKRKRERIVREEVEKDVLRPVVVRGPCVNVPTANIATIALPVAHITKLFEIAALNQPQAREQALFEVVRAVGAVPKPLRPEAMRAVIAFAPFTITALEDVGIVAVEAQDFAAGARVIRTEVAARLRTADYRRELRRGNLPGALAALEASGVDRDVVALIRDRWSRQQSPVEMRGFFLDAEMSRSQRYEGRPDETAYLVRRGDEQVKYGDVLVFDATEWLNLPRAVNLVARNADRIGAVILGWDSEGRNNFDNMDAATYPALMREYADLHAAIKAIRPELPVGLLVSVTAATQARWIAACPFEPDFLALWNVTRTGANFEKIRRLFPGRRLMIAGMNAGVQAQPTEAERRAYVDRLLKAGYVGSIWVR